MEWEFGFYTLGKYRNIEKMITPRVSVCSTRDRASEMPLHTI